MRLALALTFAICGFALCIGAKPAETAPADQSCLLSRNMRLLNPDIEIIAALRRPEELAACIAAADRGDPIAQNNYACASQAGLRVPQDDALAMRLFARAADQGNAAARYNLAIMHASVDVKGPADVKQAVVLLQKGIDEGDPYCMFGLSELYALGRGVPQDDAQATRWMKRAAELGIPRAQSSLAGYYYDGCGIPENLVEAYAWAELSCKAGDRYGPTILAKIKAKMTAEQLARGKERLASMAAATQPAATQPATRRSE